MKKILLLAPRLDISFKQNLAIKKVPPKGDIKIPIRMYWKQFIETVIDNYNKNTDIELVVKELPLWQFNQKLINSIKPDLVLVPHKEQHNFPVQGTKAYYYMQTHIPNLFSIDSKGWAAGASVYPFDNLISDTNDDIVFNNLKHWALNNNSKFEQPKYKELSLPTGFILFACQIPYDETIKYHSKIGVMKALSIMCKTTEKLNLPLVVKGHPANKDSMIPLRQSIREYKHVIWIDNVSIHQLIDLSKCVVVINSGAGMEALLHSKPVITFGQAEYDCVSNKADATNIQDILTNLHYDKDKVIKFFHSWYHWCYDITKPETFVKLPIN